MTLKDIIISQAQIALTRQQGDGSMPAGHNGPYFEPEYPIRNTAHWCLTFLHCFRVTDDAARHDAPPGSVAKDSS